MDKVAVLIPCYNESKTVKKVVEDFRKALPEAAIYVYDNNSTDGTGDLAREVGAIVRHEYQQGKGQCHPPDVPGDRRGSLCDGGRRRHLPG